MGSRYGRNQRRAHRAEIERLEAELYEAILARCGPLGRSRITDAVEIPSSMIIERTLETSEDGRRYEQTLTLSLSIDTTERYNFLFEKLTARAKCVVDDVLYRIHEINVDHDTMDFGHRSFVRDHPTVSVVLNGIGGGETAKEFAHGTFHRARPLHVGW